MPTANLITADHVRDNTTADGVFRVKQGDAFTGIIDGAFTALGGRLTQVILQRLNNGNYFWYRRKHRGSSILGLQQLNIDNYS